MLTALAPKSDTVAEYLMRPRIVIGEDHQLVLEGIKRIVEPECLIVASAGNGRDLLAQVAEHNPDIVLLDIGLPLLNGIEVARQVHRQHPRSKIVCVTMQTSQDYVREAFEAGAAAYVLKQAAATELLSAIREVQQGRFFVSSLIHERFLGPGVQLDQNPAKLFSALTPRQREVLQLVAEGKSAKEIGALLFISVKTVEFHKKHLMEELNLHSTAELIRYAVEHGWVTS